MSLRGERAADAPALAGFEGFEGFEGFAAFAAGTDLPAFAGPGRSRDLPALEAVLPVAPRDGAARRCST